MSNQSAVALAAENEENGSNPAMAKKPEKEPHTPEKAKFSDQERTEKAQEPKTPERSSPANTGITESPKSVGGVKGSPAAYSPPPVYGNVHSNQRSSGVLEGVGANFASTQPGTTSAAIPGHATVHSQDAETPPFAPGVGQPLRPKSEGDKGSRGRSSNQ